MAKKKAIKIIPEIEKPNPIKSALAKIISKVNLNGYLMIIFSAIFGTAGYSVMEKQDKNLGWQEKRDQQNKMIIANQDTIKNEIRQINKNIITNP